MMHVMEMAQYCVTLTSWALSGKSYCRVVEISAESFHEAGKIADSLRLPGEVVSYIGLLNSP